jgi:catalase
MNEETNKASQGIKNLKNQQLDKFRVDDSGKDLTTNQGLKMAEDEFSLKAGERGN